MTASLHVIRSGAFNQYKKARMALTWAEHDKPTMVQ
jgi:hypothetical protein